MVGSPRKTIAAATNPLAPPLAPGVTLLHIVSGEKSLYGFFKRMVEEHDYALTGPPPPSGSSSSAAVFSLEGSAETSPKKGKKKGEIAEKEPAGVAARQKQREKEAAVKAAALADAAAEKETRLHWRRTIIVNGRNGDGNTPLHVALYNSNIDVAKAILVGFNCE